jgi:hypothetical protein
LVSCSYFRFVLNYSYYYFSVYYLFRLFFKEGEMYFFNASTGETSWSNPYEQRNSPENESAEHTSPPLVQYQQTENNQQKQIFQNLIEFRSASVPETSGAENDVEQRQQEEELPQTPWGSKIIIQKVFFFFFFFWFFLYFIVVF